MAELIGVRDVPRTLFGGKKWKKKIFLQARNPKVMSHLFLLSIHAPASAQADRLEITLKTTPSLFEAPLAFLRPRFAKAC